jgi:hypothetical protein
MEYLFVIGYCSFSQFILFFLLQRGRPKFYAQYIRKKIEVAKAIGVIPAVVT